MQLFEIEQGDNRLVFIQRPLSQFTGFLYGLGVLAFLGWCFWLSLQESIDFMSSINILGILSMLVYSMFRIAPSLFTIARGSSWVIDMEKQTVERNGEVMATLKQIYSVRIWEEPDGEGLTRRLALQPTGSKPLILGEAYTEKEWKELKKIAQQISAFARIKLVHQ